jgi:hypothetical protein
MEVGKEKEYFATYLFSLWRKLEMERSLSLVDRIYDLDWIA